MKTGKQPLILTTVTARKMAVRIFFMMSPNGQLRLSNAAAFRRSDVHLFRVVSVPAFLPPPCRPVAWFKFLPKAVWRSELNTWVSGRTLAGNNHQSIGEISD